MDCMRISLQFIYQILFGGFYLVDFAWSVGEGNNEINNEVKKVGDKEIDKEIKKEGDNKEIDKEVRSGQQSQQSRSKAQSKSILIFASLVYGHSFIFLLEILTRALETFLLILHLSNDSNFITCCSQNSSLFKAITIIFISMIQKSLKHLSFGYQNFLLILLLQSISSQQIVKKKKGQAKKRKITKRLKRYANINLFLLCRDVTMLLHENKFSSSTIIVHSGNNLHNKHDQRPFYPLIVIYFQFCKFRNYLFCLLLTTKVFI